MLVTKYDVVNQAALLAALKSELIAAYVDAVIVPSNPERKTLAQRAAESHASDTTLGFVLLPSVLFLAYLFRSTRSPQTASIPPRHTSEPFHSQALFPILEVVSSRQLPERTQ